MAKMTVKGLDEVVDKLSMLGSKSDQVVKRALYEGTGVVADEIKENIRAIPVSEMWGTPEIPKTGPTVKERFGLLEGLGISPMVTSDGKTDVSVGFDGYCGESTKKYPTGKPVAMIARSVERGTSFMYAHKFIKPAARAAKSKAIAKMQQTAAEEIQKLTK